MQNTIVKAFTNRSLDYPDIGIHFVSGSPASDGGNHIRKVSIARCSVCQSCQSSSCLIKYKIPFSVSVKSWNQKLWWKKRQVPCTHTSCYRHTASVTTCGRCTDPWPTVTHGQSSPCCSDQSHEAGFSWGAVILTINPSSTLTTLHIQRTLRSVILVGSCQLRVHTSIPFLSRS